ncbi:MAG: SMI1/KNR4 family protein [bacterium]|nr:SMI1/KNR4 family protein [bacterium]
MEDAIYWNETTYQGPPIDDPEILAASPPELQAVLTRLNGACLFRGGLHLRGAVLAPEWHSLRYAWESEHAFHRLYPEIAETDVPFGQDSVGDQFLLRDGEVWRMLAEDGDLEPLGVGLEQFLANVNADPLDYLVMHPLVRYDDEGGRMQPGQLLVAFPPFIAAESAEGQAALQAVSALDAIRFHADLAQQLRDVPDGGRFELQIEPPDSSVS